MQIVIDIPKDVIEGAKSNPNYYPTYLFEMVWIAIRNGISLPKGHGRLGDLGALESKMNYEVHWQDTNEYGCMQMVYDAPTIIEADKEK